MVSNWKIKIFGGHQHGHESAGMSTACTCSFSKHVRILCYDVDQLLATVDHRLVTMTQTDETFANARQIHTS